MRRGRTRCHPASPADGQRHLGAPIATRCHAASARTALRALATDETGPIEGWWCASCGRIEAPQPCIGVCLRHPQPHAVVPAAAATILRRLALSTPRAGQWQRSWDALQAEARAAYALPAPFEPSVPFSDAE